MAMMPGICRKQLEFQKQPLFASLAATAGHRSDQECSLIRARTSGAFIGGMTVLNNALCTFISPVVAFFATTGLCPHGFASDQQDALLYLKLSLSPRRIPAAAPAAHPRHYGLYPEITGRTMLFG